MAQTSQQSSQQKPGTTSTQSEAHDHEEERTAEEEPPPPRDWTLPVPIDPGLAKAKLQSLANEWRGTTQTLVRFAKTLAESAEIAAEAWDPDEPEFLSVFEDMDKEMRVVCDKIYESTIRAQALQQTSTLLIETSRNLRDDAAPITDLVKPYEEFVATAMAEYNEINPKRKYSKSEEYTKFRKGFWDVHYPQQHMPDLKRLIQRYDAVSDASSSEDDDDEIELGAATVNYKDPFTMALIEDPWRNKTCSHLFDKSSIEGIFNNSGTSTTKCPHTGCNALISRATIEADPQAKRQIARIKAREAENKEKAQSQRRRHVVVDSDDDA